MAIVKWLSREFVVLAVRVRSPLATPLLGCFYLPKSLLNQPLRATVKPFFSPQTTPMDLLIHWLASSLVIIISAYLLPGVHVKGFLAALATAVVLGVLNLIVRPILLFLTLPINLLTLGLFTLVINAAIIMLATVIVPGFKVDNWWWALLFSIAVTLISLVFGLNK